MAIQDEEEIRKVCEGEKWSSVQRMKALIPRDRRVRQMVEKIILLLSKSQEQT